MAKGFHGGFGGGGNMMQMQQKIMKMQQEVKQAQDAVEVQEFTATVGGGAVSATCTGKKEFTAVTMQPDAVDPQDVEMLQDLVLSAVNEALRQADDAMENAVNKVTGGMNLGL